MSKNDCKNEMKIPDVNYYGIKTDIPPHLWREQNVSIFFHFKRLKWIIRFGTYEVH